MRIIKCDRCGKQTPQTVDLTELWTELDVNGVEYDLCPECAMLFDAFMKAPKEEPTEEPKPKQAKVDTGKLYALYDAGWKVSAIAEELRVSDQTVRNWLKKRETGETEEDA